MDNMIFAYTRQDAIDDGVFVDVSEMAKEAGIKFPVAVTSNLYNTYINPEPMPQGQDEKGRLWDLLWMFTRAARSGKSSFISFQCLFSEEEHPVKIWAVCEATSPTDPSPAINIFLPSEY